MESLNDAALTGKRVGVQVHIASDRRERDHRTTRDAGERVQVDVYLPEALDPSKSVFGQKGDVVQVEGEGAQTRQTRKRPTLHFVDACGPDAELSHVTHSREGSGAYGPDAGAREEYLGHGADVVEGPSLDASQVTVRHCQLVQPPHSGERPVGDGLHFSGLDLQQRDLREPLGEALRECVDLSAVEDQRVQVRWEVVEAVFRELVAGDECSDTAALFGASLSARDVAQQTEEEEEDCGE